MVFCRVGSFICSQALGAIRCKRWLVAGCFTLLPVFAFAGCLLDTQDVNIVALAENRAGQLLYCEYHYSEADQRKVLYVGPSGQIIATKLIDQTLSDIAPNIVQLDQRSGERREVRQLASTIGSTFQLIYQKNRNTSAEQDTVTLKGDVIVDAGFDPFVREHWDELITDEVQRFNFIAPGRSDAIRLKLVPSPKASQCGQDTIDPKQALCLTLKVSNLVIGLFADNIYLTYDRSSKKLITYQGLVNLTDERGGSLSAILRYKYPN